MRIKNKGGIKMESERKRYAQLITITQDDINTFCVLSKDTNPIHKSNSERIAPGLLVSSLFAGQVASMYPGCLLVEIAFTFISPIFADEAIYYQTEEIEDTGKLVYLKHIAKRLLCEKETVLLLGNSIIKKRKGRK
jgi:acyl dehydratase